MHRRLPAIVTLLLIAAAPPAWAAPSVDDATWVQRLSAFASAVSQHLPK